MHEQIRSFTQGVTEMREALKQVHESVRDVSSFQEIFKSPKLRGEWGEASLEHILSQHYPQELYELQHTFSNGERVDACFKLPDERLLAIDAKFPSENFSKMVESAKETEKAFYRKNFIQDVKNRIDEVASKYILPPEGTLDFALMYIPAEAIYYEIVNQIGKEVDLAGYAWSKRIILTSPNILYLTLRTVEHWFKDVQVSRETKEILKRLNRIRTDAEKLAQDFRVLGRHISNAQSAYEGSEKRLDLMVNRVSQLTSGKTGKYLEGGEEESPLSEEEKA
jgi:DNA recombination protein RmuC